MQRQWEAGRRGERRALIAEQSRARRVHASAAAEQARAVATSLLSELRAEAGLQVRPPPPPPPPPDRKVGKKRLADARLLMMLAKGKRAAAPPLRGVKYRCGACAGCMQHECGECGNCRDKKRFGGPGCRKQACSKRRCLYAHEALDDEPDNS